MVQLICWSNISNIKSSIRSISIAEKFHVWTFSFFHVFVIAILHLLFIKREREIWSFEYNFKHIRDWEDFVTMQNHIFHVSHIVSLYYFVLILNVIILGISNAKYSCTTQPVAWYSLFMLLQRCIFAWNSESSNILFLNYVIYQWQGMDFSS